MPWAKARRFYSETGTEPADGGFAVLLDGRRLKTPSGRPLTLATAALAAGVAEEWAAQDGALKPGTMPITRLACAVVDRIAPDRAAAIAHVVGYGGSDLLCYRAQGPDALVRRQQAAWGPLIEWAATALGARLTVVAGVAPVAQPAAAIDRLRAAVEAFDDARLTALTAITEASGSLILALAVVMGRIDAARAAEASQLDEAWQSETWGEDADDRKRRRALADEIAAASRFLALIAEEAEGDRR